MFIQNTEYRIQNTEYSFWLNSGPVILLLISAFSFCIVLLDVMSIGWLQFMDNVVEYREYRATNSLKYYAYAVSMFLAIFLFCFGVSKIIGMFRDSFLIKISYFGRNTFPLFFIGNIVILALPRSEIGLEQALYWFVFFLFTSLGSTLLFKFYIEDFVIWKKLISVLQYPFLHAAEKSKKHISIF